MIGNVEYHFNLSSGRVSHTLYLAHGNIKGEARGRNRHNNNVRVERNPGEMNAGTNEKSPKHGLTSAKDLTIELALRGTLRGTIE